MLRSCTAGRPAAHLILDLPGEELVPAPVRLREEQDALAGLPVAAGRPVS